MSEKKINDIIRAIQEDKYYIGFYQDGKLIAIMDLLDGYQEKGDTVLLRNSKGALRHA